MRLSRSLRMFLRGLGAFRVSHNMSICELVEMKGEKITVLLTDIEKRVQGILTNNRKDTP